MARFYTVTTNTETKTVKVPADWWPQIAGGLLALPDGTEVEASAIVASHFDSRRESPARDTKVKALDLASNKRIVCKQYILEALGFDGEDEEKLAKLGDPLSDYVAAYEQWSAAFNALKAHDANVQRSKESAAKAKLNPKPKKEPVKKGHRKVKL